MYSLGNPVPEGTFPENRGISICGLGFAKVGAGRMLRATALLIVMTLVGVPASGLACELWCGHPGGVDHHRAAGHDGMANHDGMAAHDARQMSAIGSCHTEAAISTFLAKVRQTAPRTSVRSLGTVESPAPILAGPATTTWWRVSLVRPPGEPVRHAVLRI